VFTMSFEFDGRKIEQASASNCVASLKARNVIAGFLITEYAHRLVVVVSYDDQMGEPIIRAALGELELGRKEWSH
jgi:hypothetical protein